LENLPITKETSGLSRCKVYQAAVKTIDRPSKLLEVTQVYINK